MSVKPSPVVHPFAVQPSVHENVVELRRALGSATRSLSHADLAKLLNEREATRKRSLSTIQRWERDGVQPDYESVRIMAELAGCSFEEFALGLPPKSGGIPLGPGGVPLEQPAAKKRA